MSTATAAPLVISIRSLRKDRTQGQGAAYSLNVPRLDVRLGEKLLITGPSGCGKSTLLDIIGMVLRPDGVRNFLFSPEARNFTGHHPERAAGTGPDSGAALLPKRPLGPKPVSPHANRPRDIALAWSKGNVESLSLWRRHVGYVLQTGGLLPFISVRENIMTSRRLLGGSDDPLFAALPEKLILALGIRHLLHKLPGQLSVGERQRVAIARALAGNPPLVLADEPTAALDPANAAGVLSLFSRMVDELGSTVILVSHAPEQMRGMGFRRLQVRLDAFVKNDVTGTRAVLADSEIPPESAPEHLPPSYDQPGGQEGGGACLR